MAKITYITHDNQNHTIEVQKGLTVMEGAVQNDIPGIFESIINNSSDWNIAMWLAGFYSSSDGFTAITLLETVKFIEFIREAVGVCESAWWVLASIAMVGSYHTDPTSSHKKVTDFEAVASLCS